MDAVTLDGLVGEISPHILGRHLGRARLASPVALSLEVSGGSGRRLWLDAGRGTAGLYLLSREAARRVEALAAGEPGGGARQAILHARKHLNGARVRRLERVRGTRVLLLEVEDGVLVLGLQASPGLGIAVGGTLLGTVGGGPLPWPPPSPAPEREWDTVSAADVAAAVGRAQAEGRGSMRAVLDLCPGLSPALARELDAEATTFERLRGHLREARPILVAPGPPAAWRDADLAVAGRVALWPFPPSSIPAGSVAMSLGSWTEAAAHFLEGQLRGRRFEELHRQRRDEVRREIRRLSQLRTHLERDLAGLPDETGLRYDAEALLARPDPLPAGLAQVDVVDPRDPTRTRRVAVDPQLGGPRNADLLFAKARRVERARGQMRARLDDVATAFALARENEEVLRSARDARDLEGPARAKAGAARPVSAPPEAGLRHYLSSRGLSILVGRGARENHHLTFTVAGPEDLWLHARDVPGAHVILKDSEGRAAPMDLREAAEVAAFFSDAADEGQADVHVARRKHVRPARGGTGRVIVGHSETLRIAPRDPEGRLRRRAVKGGGSVK